MKYFNLNKRSLVGKMALLAFIGLVVIGIMNRMDTHMGEHKVTSYGNGYTVYNTSYGTQVSVYDALVDFIRADYGDAAAEAYVQGVVSGDYYQYRSITGFWKPTYEDPKLRAHAMSNKGDPLWFFGIDTVNEGLIYQYFGAYGTAADYVALCQQYNVASFSQVWAPGNDGYAMCNGQMPLANSGKVAKISKQQYLANHSSTATPAPAASTLTVEALKNYAGNNAEFNAYNYYTRNADLQTAIGPNGDKLLQHWNQYGKAEGRVAK